MPRSFLVKQQDKTIDDKRNDQESVTSTDPRILSLPPPLLKVSPRPSSLPLLAGKEDRHLPLHFTSSPSEPTCQSIIKSEADHVIQPRGPTRKYLPRGACPYPTVENYYLDDLARDHGYRNIAYAPKEFPDTGFYQMTEQKFHLQQRMELEKKGLLCPVYSTMYHDPYLLYQNNGFYGESTFNQVNLMSKYYMTMPMSSRGCRISDMKEQSIEEDAKKQVDSHTAAKSEPSTDETAAVQSNQRVGAVEGTESKTKTPSQGDSNIKAEQPATAKKYRYTCDVCGKSFSRSNTLTTHKRIHTGAKPFVCEQCGRAFRQPGNLTRHRLTHTAIKPYVCTQCNKAFNRASNLHTHMRTHTNYKPFVCDFCGKGFHQKIDMKIHRYTHTGEKPHKCTKCGRGFKQLTHLTYHMRTHSDERLYKCEYCGKGFNQKGNLQAHIYGHTGERPFKCDICGKGFTLASTLNTHKRTHATKKPFECQFCGKAFYQKNALKTHYIASHPFANGMSLL